MGGYAAAVASALMPARLVQAPGALVIFAVSAIFLQKLGVTVGGGSIGLNVAILWAVLLWLLLRGVAVIDPLRAFLFVALSFTTLFSLLIGLSFGETIKSLPSLTIFLLLYASMLVRVDVDRATLLRYLRPFQVGMLISAGIVLGQQVMQYTIGHRYWPNLERVVPSALLIHGYAYLRPYSWNSPYLTPNGIFFMEPSALSLFLALALAAEIIWFRRLIYVVLLAAALVAGMAGTGPTIIAILFPLILRKMERRLMHRVVLVGVPLVVLLTATGSISHLAGRAAEFTDPQSSAYARVVLPFRDTARLVMDPAYLVMGQGPGTSPKGDNQVQWPINKLTFEYGLATAIMFHVFLLVAALGSAPSKTLALVMLVPQLVFGGGLVAHTNLMMLVLFGSLFRLKPEVATARAWQQRRLASRAAAEFKPALSEPYEAARR